MSERTDWFGKCGWGVFCHWLALLADKSGGNGSAVTADDWNRAADQFDAVGLAEQLQSVGAPYFFITIGQNSGHYLAPNETYDRLAGIVPGKCSKRDIVSDLHAALSRYGIRLMVYITSGAPCFDKTACERLGWEWGYADAEPGAWSPELSNKRLAGFQRRWESIIRDWSLRWGPKIGGWWVDGCYFSDAMYRHDDEPNFKSFAAALRAGNPDSLVAFNFGPVASIYDDGSGRYVKALTPEEDYTAGEQDKALPQCAGPFVDCGGRNVRWHVLTYLGESWCSGSPRFPAELPAGYTEHVICNGGVVSWDVPIQLNGRISEKYMAQLSAISQAAERARGSKKVRPEAS